MDGKKLEKKNNESEVINLCALCESRNANQRCGGCRLRWYCSKECQVLHWKKGGHKTECRVLIQTAAEEAQNDRLTNTSDRRSDKTEAVICAICLESPEKPEKLPCSHEFCITCVDALRSRGLQQLCPLCRKPLPPGPEKLREQADRLYIQVSRQISRGNFSWSSLSLTFRQKMKNAAILYHEAAAQGDAQAQSNLGFMYARGHGVSQDYGRAVELFKKSANQGYAQAQFNLGFMYANGQGVSQDYGRALELYSKSANQGYAQAQCNLGSMYAKGHGVSQDYGRAAELFRRSANQGDAGAQFGLGLLYEHGMGVSQNYERAVGWYRKAANQGYADAQQKLESI